MRRWLTFALIAGGAATAAAQSATPTFQIVSIKRNVSGSFPISAAARPGGAFVSANVTLESIIRFAYNLPEYQIAGGPGWLRMDRFDVEARADRDVSTDEVRRMVQALLTDRFQLVVRREQREMRTYVLLLARNDKQLGPNLRQSAACAESGGRGKMEERRTPNGGVATQRTCAPMAALVSSLSSALQSPVDDRTGLTGLWDSELSFTGERRRTANPAAVAADPNEAPALFTAVQEQLGLRLDAGQGLVEVLVIESAAQPTEN